MSVYERTRELGVMQAVGMRPGHVVQLVLVESLALAVISAVLGVLLGGLLDLYLMQVGIDLAVNDQGEGFQISGVTLDAVLYGAFKLEHVVVPTLTLFAVSALGSIWPALRAALLDPVAAMRQD
jgi:ABC-type lipoprotein release transport system permease subunit